MNCQYCLENFENQEYFDQHIKQARICFKYKDVLFTCKNCKFSTVGIKNIDKHIKSCKQEKNDDNASYELLSDDEKEETIQLTILNRIEKKLDNLIKNIKVPKKLSSMPVHFIQPENKENKEDEQKITAKKKNKDTNNTLKKNLSEIESCGLLLL